MSALKVVRGDHTGGHVRLANDTVRPRGAMSMQALGLLAHLLSQRDGWEVSVQLLAREFSNGEHAVKSTVRELENAGHVVRARRNTGRGFVHFWTVYEQPIGRKPTGGLSTDGKAADGKPTDGKAADIKKDHSTEDHPQDSALRAGSTRGVDRDPDAALDAIDQRLDLDAAEARRVEGMLANGSHPKAVVNAILAERRRAGDMWESFAGAGDSW